MKKLLLSILSFAIFAAHAQNKGEIALRPAFEMGFPASQKFKDNANIGFGGSLKGLYGLSDATALTLTVGYIAHSKEIIVSGTTISTSLGVIPVMLGLRQTMNGFYVEPQLGYTSYLTKATIGTLSDTVTGDGFSYALGIGYIINKVIDLGVRYQGGKGTATVSGTSSSSDFGHVAVHVGYIFGLGKK